MTRQILTELTVHGNTKDIMAKETRKIKAYTQFLQKDQSPAFWKELAGDVGIDVTTLRRWSVGENWVERKKEFFKKISLKIDDELDKVAENIAKLKVEFAQNIIASIKDRFQEEIAEIPIGSFKEMMQGIDTAINSVDRLLNLSSDSEKVEASPYASMTIEQKKQLLETIDTVKIQLPSSAEGQRSAGTATGREQTVDGHKLLAGVQDHLEEE